MAVKILNLDEMLAQEPERKIIWRGKEYTLTGLTGETYLKYLAERKKLDAAVQNKDEAAQWESNLRMIGILVPDLAGELPEIQRLPIAVLSALVEYIVNELLPQAQNASGATTGE